MHVTVVLILATAITFFLVGAVVVATIAMAALSHRQDRLYRKSRGRSNQIVRPHRVEEPEH